MTAKGGSKIVSAAQHTMFTKAAADPVYAKSRGLTVDLAKQMLADHAASGAPGASALPPRAKSDPKPTVKASSQTQMRGPVYLTSRRDA